MPTADREGLGVDREALRHEMARLGFNGWYGRDEYDDHPVQGMWERTADAQLAGPLLSALLAQADTAERMADDLVAAGLRILALSAEVEALRAALDDVAGKAGLARAIYQTEEAATPSYVADAFGVIEQFAASALARTTDQPDPGAREGSSLPVEAAAQEGQSHG